MSPARSKKPAPAKRTPRKNAATSDAVIAGEGVSLPAQTFEGEKLLQRCRNHWQLGDWQSLADLAQLDLETHPDRDKLALMAAAGLGQLGDIVEMRRHVALAQGWGAHPELVARVVLSGLENGLGRAALVLHGEAAGTRHFQSAIATLTPDADTDLLGRAREMQEKVRLGLLPAALRLVKEDLSGNRTISADHAAFLQGLLTQITHDQQQGYLPSLALHRRTPAQGDTGLPALPLILCAHHKSGTSFLRKAFLEIAQEFDLPLWQSFYDRKPKDWQIFINQHCRLEDVNIGRDFRGLHFIRHPKGLFLSAALYHIKCSEPWVDVPLEKFDSDMFWALTNRETYNKIKDPEVSIRRKARMMHAAPKTPAPIPRWSFKYDFGGRTYREILKSLGSIEERVAFEMQAFSRGVMNDMLAFPADARFFPIRLEDVSHDPEMTALKSLFRHLGFSGAAYDRCLEIAQSHCLWHVGKVNHSTTGVSQRWRDQFAGDLETQYQQLFPGAAQALGYPD